MKKRAQTVFLLVWTGDATQAETIVQRCYPGCQLRMLSRRELRESGWRGQLRALRQMHGHAFVFYFHSLDQLHEKLLLAWSGLLHRCKETSFLDSTGRSERYRRADWVLLLPQTILAAMHDLFIFVFSWLVLEFLRLTKPKPVLGVEYQKYDLDIAYLYPLLLHRPSPGGAMSHVRGFLGGLKEQGACCEIFAANPLSDFPFPYTVIPPNHRNFLFGEAKTLSYNWTFARQVREAIGTRRIRALYQRHGRFVLVGLLLSRLLRIPLILEFNGFEEWMARHWDPGRFVTWLRVCEEASLAGAALIVVVSEALREELLAKGIEPHRILVNPNAVNPKKFHPNSGGRDRRRQFGFAREDIVATFIGSFSYWHGISVLEKTITLLLRRRTAASSPRLRFLLIGDGPLCAELRENLCQFAKAGQVIFTGIIPHDEIVSYLDASDIFLSPHVPMPDGRPFFGSPTKLFEYMSMAKAIVASDLDQIGSVLRHQENAWLVPPGDAGELSNAIELLSAEPAVRAQLGSRAREAVLARHTWALNAQHVLTRVGKFEQSQSRDAVAENSTLDDARNACTRNRHA
jgi:glycosyltransferase involved in cell wall biosynthesis